MTFKVDRIRLKTMADGSYQIVLDVGEYEKKAMQEVVGLPIESVYNVTIEPDIKKVEVVKS